MSKKASPTLIGAFVVGGIVLAVVVITLFGGQEFFRAKNYVVMFFEGSVNGLNVGSPVMFRGVKVGTVTDIRMVLDPETLEIGIPVTAEIDPKSLSRSSPEQAGLVIPADALVSKGLRAQLQTQSLLTGQLYIELDFQPDKPMRLAGEGLEYPEIPTIPTPIQELGKKLEQFNLEQVLSDASSSLKGLSELVNSADLRTTIQTLNTTLNEYTQVARDLNKQVASLAKSTDTTLHDTRATLASVRKAFDESDALFSRADQALQKLGGAADEATAAIGDARQTISPDSRLLYDLSMALEELAHAARAIRALADTLERQPDAVLRGKAVSGEK